MSAQTEAAAVRAGAGLFRPADRGLLEVSGGDRTRWLDGMVSNDVTELAPGPERSGCPALLLSRKGRLVTDLQVLLRPDAFWLELPAAAAGEARIALEAFVVADDVRIDDIGAGVGRLALEGPEAAGILAEALGNRVELVPHACLDSEIAGVPVVVAAFGWSGEPAFQILLAGGTGSGGEAVAHALLAAGAEPATAEALEILRIESGRPRLGAELSGEVLPAEARLEGSISFEKGCYTGQEIVARIESRARLTRRLVGLDLGASPEASLPEPGAHLTHEGERVGVLTSVCRSPAVGAIGLGYVKVAWEAAGTELSVDGRVARVAELPFVSPGSASPGNNV